MQPTRSRRFAAPLALALLAVGWAWILWTSLAYASPGLGHPFLREKLPLPADDLWLAALRVHVASALLTFPACLLLLSDRLRLRFPAAHRLLGRLTGLGVLLALIPTGAFLAFTATGGWPSTLGFLVSGLWMGIAMVGAVISARRRRFAQHRRWTWHVVGQMAVAVISRAMLLVAAWLELAPEPAYVVSLWVPVLGVAWGVERLARRPSAGPFPVFPGGVLVNTLVRPLPFALLLAAVASAAFAAPSPSSPEAALALVQRQLVEPLVVQEQASTSGFSRAPRPPAARRARIPAPTASVDASGASFFAFEVDSRWSADPGSAWDRATLTGCVYPDSGRLYVDLGGALYAHDWMLGGSGDEAPEGACQPVGAPRT